MGSISDTRNLTYDRNKSDEMYLVVVYYPKFEYTRINQLPKMTSFDLVSLVGGTLGLFTGVGFFTLIDIIEIFLEMLGGFCVKAKKVNVNLSKPRLVVRLILQVEENPLTDHTTRLYVHISCMLTLETIKLYSYISFN